MKPLLAIIVAFASMKAIPRQPDPEPTDREKVLAVALTQVGITEKTGRNDGDVEKYIESVGLNPKGRYPYCAAYVFWCGREALGDANPFPKSAWSPDHLRGGIRVTESTSVKGAETFGIYGKSQKRIIHTGFIKEKQGSSFITVEANTSATAAVGSVADRDGHGVFSKRRLWRTIHSIKDHIKD